MVKDEVQRVRVGIRIRPLNEREITKGAQNVLNVRNKTGIYCHIPSRVNNFNFDWAFGPEEKQKQVYSSLSEPILENIFEGINATILAYGQTGSGKTHTIGGGDCSADATDSLDSEDFGFIPRIVRDIFDEMQRLRDMNAEYQAEVQMSYMEVYKEDCFDLLVKDRPKVELRESGKGEVLVDGLRKLQCARAEDIHRALQEASYSRATSATLMNSKSSRSHAILTLHLKVTRPVDMDMDTDVATNSVPADNLITFTSRLNVVDLAGSERVKKTGASGDTLKEGIAINQGLLALGNVIEALSKKSLLPSDSNESAAMHIPYRDAKITRLLKDSLGGNNVTILLACVSPADLHSEETMNTLRFASRAMEVINKAHANTELAAGRGTSAGGYISQEEGDRLGLEVLTLKMEVLKCQKVIAQLEQQQLVGDDSRNENRNSDFINKSSPIGNSYLTAQTQRSYYQLCKLLRSVLRSAIEESLQLDEVEIEQYIVLIKKMNALYTGVKEGITSDSLLRARVAELEMQQIGGATEGDNFGEGRNDELLLSTLMLPVVLRCLEELEQLLEVMEAVHGGFDNNMERVQHIVNGSTTTCAASIGTAMDDTVETADTILHLGDGDNNDIDNNDIDNISRRICSGRTSDASVDSQSSADLRTAAEAEAEAEAEAALATDPDAQKSTEIQTALTTKLDRASKINSFLSDFESNMAALKAEINTLQVDKLQISTSIGKVTGGTGGGVSSTNVSSGKPTAAFGSGSSRPSYMASTKGASAHMHSCAKPGSSSHSHSHGHIHGHAHGAPHNRPFGASSAAGGGSGSVGCSNTSMNPKVVERLKSDLSAKSKLLEEKLKELKAKEQEYRHVTQEKKQVDQEVGSLRSQFDALKARRVALVAQLKDEKIAFQVEKKRLVQSEQLCKKRERSVVHNLNKLEHEVSNKERVWRSQLEAKERETKKLKELINKQTVVREIRAANTGCSVSSSSSTSCLSTAQEGNGFEHPTTRRHQGDIKTQVLQLLNQEKLKANFAEEISLECKLRGQAARQLNMMKSRQKLDAITNPNSDNGANDSAILKEMAVLENEVKTRSALILARQGALADLNSNGSSKNSTSPWDTLCKNSDDYKLAMITMLSHVSAAANQQALAAKAFEAKIALQSAEIRRLKAGLNNEQQRISNNCGLKNAGSNNNNINSVSGRRVSALPRKPGLPVDVFRRPQGRQQQEKQQQQNNSSSGASVEKLDNDDENDDNGSDDSVGEAEDFDYAEDISEDEQESEEEDSEIDTEDEYVPGLTPRRPVGGRRRKGGAGGNTHRAGNGATATGNGVIATTAKRKRASMQLNNSDFSDENDDDDAAADNREEEDEQAMRYDGNSNSNSNKQRRVLQDITNGTVTSTAAIANSTAKRSSESVLRSLTVALLKDRCKVLGLPVSGRKDDLITRLLTAGDTGGQLKEDEDEKVNNKNRASPPTTNTATTAVAAVAVPNRSHEQDPLADCRSFYNRTTLPTPGKGMTEPMAGTGTGAAGTGTGRIKLNAALAESSTIALDLMLETWESEQRNHLQDDDDDDSDDDGVGEKMSMHDDAHDSESHIEVEVMSEIEPDSMNMNAGESELKLKSISNSNSSDDDDASACNIQQDKVHVVSLSETNPQNDQENVINYQQPQH